MRRPGPGCRRSFEKLRFQEPSLDCPHNVARLRLRSCTGRLLDRHVDGHAVLAEGRPTSRPAMGFDQAALVAVSARPARIAAQPTRIRTPPEARNVTSH